MCQTNGMLRDLKTHVENNKKDCGLLEFAEGTIYMFK